MTGLEREFVEAAGLKCRQQVVGRLELAERGLDRDLGDRHR